MVEEVPYEVLRKIEDVEIRRYPPIILAKVSNREPNYSFSILFNYIQGSNRSRKKISMTSPVVSSRKIAMTAPVVSDEGTFSFVLPDDMIMEDVPIPVDRRISIEKVKGRVLAVIRYNGRTKPDRVRSFEKKLLEVLSDNNIRPIGDPILMRYNPPFVPGPFRRNESAVEIKYTNVG